LLHITLVAGQEGLPLQFVPPQKLQPLLPLLPWDLLAKALKPVAAGGNKS
jgi:hypothetical protein